MVVSKGLLEMQLSPYMQTASLEVVMFVHMVYG